MLYYIIFYYIYIILYYIILYYIILYYIILYYIILYYIILYYIILYYIILYYIHEILPRISTNMLYHVGILHPIAAINQALLVALCGLFSCPKAIVFSNDGLKWQHWSIFTYHFAQLPNLSLSFGYLQRFHFNN